VAAVEEIARGEVLPTLRPGTTYIDMSTVPPALARDLAAAGAARGVRVLDAPISGGQRGAVEATLTVMAGGDAATLDEVRDVLGGVATTIVHVGPPGAGQVVKAASQLLVGGTLGLIAEAIVLLEASGVDASRGLDVLAHGLAGSRLLDLRRAAMVAREFVPGGRAELHHKDMGIVLDQARDVGVVVPMASWTAQMMASLVAQGLGDLDHTAVLKIVEQLSGRSGR
jgi:2-hydroxy-3-oxopropionate reductase